MQSLTFQDLSNIGAFTRVVDMGSFTAAAGQLGVSKATVSKHVTMIEEHLGVRLLDRTTRVLRLTEAGEKFYSHCQHIMAELSAAEIEAMQFGEPHGKLRVWAPASLGRLHVAPVLREFLERYPNIEIDFTLCDRTVELVEEDFDVAILIARQEYPSLRCKRLAPCAQVVCAAPGYLDRHGTPSAPEELLEHNCITCADPSNSGAWQLEGPNGPQSVKVGGSFRTNSGDALRMAVLSELGVALIPMFLVGEDLEAGRLCRVLPQYMHVSHSIYAVFPRHNHVSLNVNVFVEFLELCLAPLSDQASVSGAPLDHP